ncbi:tRNA3(Ser)-specific nuclease WapA precursor [Planctomycetes bacterium CA13]|uniref:tRNA3(Ser)-specific nuclease WapA n=1 Tax=Novipirellula herctigrandis TaxID=2527986 RepID=A0A5C5ZCS2_9BACT|nr:tRNA3(Ser)-specific nuclease WapA precursor [Planctomycetes bacterium CA13]
MSSLTYPDGSPVARTYTDRGQLATVAFNNTTVDTRTYDDGGRMTGSSYNNGVSESRTYNTDNTLAGITFSGAPIEDLTYGWDANKNKTSETITGTMSGYGFTVPSSGYDDEDRLVGWNRSDSNLDQAWNLSLVGDWNSFTENASVQSRTHGPTHEILSAAGQAVQHDAKGNQTLLPTSLSPLATSLSLHWDFENKLLGADVDNDGSDDVTYQFDALGRRVARDDGTTVTVFVQSGQQTIADYVSGAVPASPTYTYVYASYIDEPVIRGGTGGLRYYHRNQQYSVIALTDGGGLIKERYAYTAYGEPTILDSSLSVLATSLSSNRYTYTGREWDEALGLYHYRARMYDSVAGRFCSRDPIGYADTMLLYSFLLKSVLGQVDPSGFFSTSDRDVSIASTCLRQQVQTLINPGTQPSPVTDPSCGMRVMELALEGELHGQSEDLMKDTFKTLIGPGLPSGIPGHVADAVVDALLDISLTGDTDVGSTTDVRDRVEGILRKKLGDHFDELERRAIDAIIDTVIDGLSVPEGCQRATFSGSGSNEESSCQMTIFASAGTTRWRSKYSITDGVCFYKCKPGNTTGSVHKTQRCCCGTSRTVTFGPISGTANNTFGGGCTDFQTNGVIK